MNSEYEAIFPTVELPDLPLLPPRRSKEDVTAGGTLLYIAQVEIMRDHELTTMYVDFTHILKQDDVLAQAIQTKYYRFMPYLKRAVSDWTSSPFSLPIILSQQASLTAR